MPSASAVRVQVESALADRIPSALSPAVRTVRPVVSSGVESLDSLLKGGFPVGGMSEVTGPECSGRTSLAHSLVARVIESGKVAAWIDVSDTFDAPSAAAAGIELERLLWVRCGTTETSHIEQVREFVVPDSYLIPSTPKRGLHGGGHGTHPRQEAKGLSTAISGLLQGDLLGPRCAESQHKFRPAQVSYAPASPPVASSVQRRAVVSPYQRIEQGLRSADLILQAGGFGAIVLDLGSFAPEFVSRIDLATWHRYRVAAERTQSSIVLLTQYVCAKSSAELSLRLHPAEILREEATVFSGTQPKAEVARQRFQERGSNVLPIRKPPQSANTAGWRNRAIWVGPR
jgi:recombination protein RecA